MSRRAIESSLVMTSMDHHEAAAEHHHEAAESHRLAAAHYLYGNYQEAQQYARLAEGYGKQAADHCAWAMG